MATVYVVSMHNKETGNFNWFWTLEDAQENYAQEVKTWEYDPRAVVRLVMYEVDEVPARDDKEARNALSDEIDANTALIEGELPAILSNV